MFVSLIIYIYKKNTLLLTTTTTRPGDLVFLPDITHIRTRYYQNKPSDQVSSKSSSKCGL